MKHRPHPLALVLLGSSCLALCACAGAQKRELREEIALEPPALQAVLQSIDEEDLARHVRVLASDAYGGRAPGTEGEELSVAYLVEELAAAGAQPGGEQGSWTQRVPLVGITSATSVRVTARGEALELSIPDELVAGSRRAVPVVDVERSPLVFAGYGVQAPEHEWDDFAGLDVAGKTLIVLVNDPPVRAGDGPDAALDEGWFKGRAMTYYGRWTYKYETASRLGAAAVLIVHQDEAAGYGWSVVQTSFGREAFEIERGAAEGQPVPVQGWLTHAAAERLLAACGEDLASLEREARTPGFRARELAAEASFHVENDLRRVESRNVVARVEGSDARVSPEHVLFTAHWDHLGTDPAREGDGIYNGAVDNASGCAGLLELAEAFAGMRTKPRRSLLFVFTTAEEKGLLGSRWYAAHPLVPLERTLAVINLDGLNVYGDTHDIGIVGYGNTTLDDLVIAAAALQGRTVVPDQEPEKGYYFRSDHFELAKLGVPALHFDGGRDYVGRPADYAERVQGRYLRELYHEPGDEIGPDWDLSGTVTDLVLAFRVALLVADGEAWPEWKPGSEFRAVREASLGGEGGDARP